jgi:hypothetical protein
MSDRSSKDARIKFETLGNATLQVFEADRPVLATDPWLVGTAYFGSWALDHDLTASQIANVITSPFVWISHGHPDHLHPESLQLLSRQQHMLIPDHYHPEIKHFLEGEGFPVSVLPFKRWHRLTPSIRVMCLENENQDAILAVEAGEAIILDVNDSPLYGEEPFFKRLVRRYRRSFLLSLCSIDADMLNLVDEHGRRVVGPPEQRKSGAIQAVGDLCVHLGVTDFCCFSSQHLYVRPDSTWANPYRISFADMKAHWNSPARLIEPFVTIDLSDGTITPNHPSHRSDVSRIAPSTGGDDWQEKMEEEDWQKLERFVLQFRTLKKRVDFVRFTVADESRTFQVSSRRGGGRGVTFAVPRHSLMETVTSGYFDDLLIGNFMTTHLSHMRLYPDFSPLVAKFGGSAKVYTPSQLWACRLHYFRLSPAAYVRYHFQQYWLSRWKSRVRALAKRLGLFEKLKAAARRMKGLPPLARPRGT